MVRHIDRTARLAILALALLFSAPTAAAPAGEAQEAQAPAPQVESGDKSYLPPWMQNQEVAGINGAADPNNPPAIQKIPASGHTQRPPRRHRSDFLTWPGFGIFGR
ncbi:MAG: hypothetical protein ACLPWS_19645 [Rhodomicrobium sp.]